MPSIKSLSLAAAGLVSMVSAFPQGGFQNTTTNAGGNGTTVVPVGGNGANPGTNPTTGGTVAGSGNGTTVVGPTAGNRTADNSFFCPRLSGSAFTNGNGASFLIECDTSHFGVVININIAKRQTVLPTNLGDCLNRCDNVAGCVGTAFNSGLQTCTFFSEVGAAFNAPGVSFGVRVGTGPAASVAAGATLTSTILQTKVVTISSCAPTVTNCPIGAVVTQVQAVSTTQYICPTATIVPVAPVACGCAYGVSTVAGYKSTVTLGSTILIPVTSTVVAVPKPSVTEYKFTTGVAVCPTCPGGAASTPATTPAPSATTVCPGGCKTNGTSTATTSMAVFKGAADQVKAGMGMGAIVAAAALLL